LFFFLDIQQQRMQQETSSQSYFDEQEIRTVSGESSHGTGRRISQMRANANDSTEAVRKFGFKKETGSRWTRK
jgi:hypothetical protein